MDALVNQKPVELKEETGDVVHGFAVGDDSSS